MSGGSSLACSVRRNLRQTELHSSLSRQACHIIGFPGPFAECTFAGSQRLNWYIAHAAESMTLRSMYDAIVRPSAIGSVVSLSEGMGADCSCRPVSHTDF